MRILAVVVVLGLLSPFASVARADDAQRAKELFAEGTRYFDLGQFDKAIDAWQAGYREKADSRFLYNIAQAYRLAGDTNKAIFFYKGYLRNSPKASNRTEVEQKIQALQKQATDDASKPAGRGAAPPTGDNAAEAGRARPPTPPPVAPPQPPVMTAPAAGPGSGVGAPPPAGPATTPPPTGAGAEPPTPAVTGGPEAPPPTVVAPASDAALVEGLRPIDIGVALGVDGWSSGVQGKADASFALLLAGGYTFGGNPSAPARFRLGAGFGYTFLKEAASRETFLSLLLVPTLVVRATPRLGFFGELGVGVVGIIGLKATSALLDHTMMLKIDGAQALFELRPALGVTLRLTPALGLFASAATNYSPKRTHFYQAINRPEILLGVALRI